MIALAELRGPAVAIDWHEAVAIAAAIADSVEGERLPVVPALDDLQLADDGTIVVVRLTATREPPVVALAARLAVLLEAAPCPAELRQLIDAAAVGGLTFDRLRERLHFFERPGRTTTLMALAARGTLMLEQARNRAELQRLTERARQQSGEPGTAGVPAATRADRRPGTVDRGPVAAYIRQHALPAAVAVTVFVAMAIAVATLFPGDLTESPPASDPPEIDEPRPLPPAASADGPAPAREAPVPGTATERVPAKPPSTGRSQPGRDAAPPAPDPGTPGPGSPGVDVRVNELGGTPLPHTGAASPDPVRSSSGGRIYSAGDPGVTPARLVRPHLPAEPPADVPPEQVGTLELLIDERGMVETVHLISPANRYQERMLVAAAKSWVFEPAMKDGRPVRFRARLRVTL